MSEPARVLVPKKRKVFVLLGLLLGNFGMHNFYAGYHRKGAVQLLITLALGWIVIGFVITSVWALVEVKRVRRDAHGVEMA